MFNRCHRILDNHIHPCCGIGHGQCGHLVPGTGAATIGNTPDLSFAMLPAVVLLGDFLLFFACLPCSQQLCCQESFDLLFFACLPHSQQLCCLESFYLLFFTCLPCSQQLCCRESF